MAKNADREFSKEHIEEMLMQVVQGPLKLLEGQEPGLLKIGTSGALYKEKTRQAEGFLRLLWGLGPYYAQRESDDQFELVVAGIKAGVDPSHSSYWGEIGDYNQLMVEMAPLGVFITLNHEKIMAQLTEQDQHNLIAWLEQINCYQPAPNNWLFFRVLVNVALASFGIDHREQIDCDLAEVETFYLGNGWYCDGKPYRMDYYVSFAIHYYSLIYAVLFAEEDPERARLFKERAAQFSETFQYWFDKEGRGLPFGRSLTYRFAQSSFWAAMLYAGVTDFPVETSRYLLIKNVEHWLKQAIFSEDGYLTVGYYYENLNMAEEYNAPGSPYWGLKAFLVLALAEDNSVWEDPLVEPPNLARQKLLPEAKMLVTRHSENTDLHCFPTGQYCEQHAQGDAKYGKFVYSTNFGFSVPKGLMTLERGAFDNGLAVSERDDYYRTRTQVTQSVVTERFVYSEWQPWENVRISTVVIPFYPWHVRIHVVESGRLLRLSDGGFSVPFDGPDSVEMTEEDDSLFLASKTGISAMKKYGKSQILKVGAPQANVNLLHNCVVIPYLLTDVDVGRTVLSSSFMGATSDLEGQCSAPLIKQEGDVMVVSHQGETYRWHTRKNSFN